MRRTKLEKFTASLCVLDIIAGVVLASGISEGTFHTDPFKMFTVLNALWALLYYLLELRWLQIGGRGFLSTGMRFTVMVNSAGMAVISLLYLGPMHASFGGTDYLALLLLQYLLPLLMILDWLVGPKNYFRKKHILYAMILPLLYNAAALILGTLGFGIGLDGAQYPYPFLHVDQLGWGIVLANIGMIMVGQYFFCRIWVWLDRLGSRR
jgi:hypothetical protein